MDFKKKLSLWLVSERTIMFVILFNAIAIFLYSVPSVPHVCKHLFLWVDNLCAIYFLIEVITKIRIRSFKLFWLRAWDRFDFFLVVITLPSLFEAFIPLRFLPILLCLRLLRLLRFLKILKFIPNSIMLIAGLKRALKASLGIVLCLLILNIIFSLGATILFGSKAPELFGSPFSSMYHMFKVFTIEGWHEIPDQLVQQGGSESWIFGVRAYFIFAVSIGGLLGLSLANAIFVDEMTIDNNMKLEKLVRELTKEVRHLRDEVSSNNDANE